VWNDALGAGGFSSRLLKVVRVAGGKTYGASSGFDRNAARGALVASTFTRTEETVATLRLVLGEFEKMAAGGPTDPEVASAIAHVAGSYTLHVTGADDLAAALVTADLHGLSQVYVTDFPLLVGRVTRDEAAAAAAEVLTPATLAVVLVGDGAKIAPQLTAAGIGFQRVAWNDPIGPQPAGDKPSFDAAKLAAAAQLLDLAIAAKGERVTKLKALRMTASGTLDAQGQKVDVVFKRTLALPDRMRMDITLAKQLQIAIAEVGDHGWQAGPGGIADSPASQLPALEQQRFVDPELVLVHARAPGVTAALTGTDKVDGAVCDVLHVVGPGDLEVFLLIDQQTHLLRQTRYLNGGSETRETFTDYRLVDGMQVAHHRLSVGGDERSELTVDAVELDPTVADGDFAKPAP
jgi:hypothetical protein